MNFAIGTIFDAEKVPSRTSWAGETNCELRIGKRELELGVFDIAPAVIDEHDGIRRAFIDGYHHVSAQFTVRRCQGRRR